MKKKITILLIAALSVVFVVGCTNDEATPETPETPSVETPEEEPNQEEEEPAEEPAPTTVSINSLLASRELTADDQANAEKMMRLMRSVEDTVQVAILDMTEIDGGFRFEFLLKNNFAEKTVVTENTNIAITTQTNDIVDIPVPMDIEIDINGGAIFETEVLTDALQSRRDVYFIEFTTEEAAE